MMDTMEAVFLVAVALNFFVGAIICGINCQTLCNTCNSNQLWNEQTTKVCSMLDYMWVYLGGCGLGVLLYIYHGLTS